jgi:hypothetical protein
MIKLPDTLVRWLVLAALVDWLVTRTLTRAGIFMPKPPPVILVYQGLGLLGQFAATLAGLLTLASLAWLAWRGLRTAGLWGPSIAVLAVAGLSVAFLFVPAQGWLSAGYHLVLLALTAWAGLKAWNGAADLPKKLACGTVALALLASQAYQLILAVSSNLHLAYPPEINRYLFLLGELLAVLSPIVLWSAYARQAPRWTWLAAALPALAFAGMRLAAPAMTGILAIWSTGLTLYLPWPVYVFSLWAAGVTAIDCLKRGEAAGWAVLLLAAGGYAPQLSVQAFLGLLALWLLIPSGSQVETFEEIVPALAAEASR